MLLVLYSNNDLSFVMLHIFKLVCLQQCCTLVQILKYLLKDFPTIKKRERSLQRFVAVIFYTCILRAQHLSCYIFSHHKGIIATSTTAVERGHSLFLPCPPV